MVTAISKIPAFSSQLATSIQNGPSFANMPPVATISADEFQRLQALQSAQPTKRTWIGAIKDFTAKSLSYLVKGTYQGLKNVVTMFHPSNLKRTLTNVAIGTAVITAASTVFLWHFAPLAIPFNALASLAMDMVFEFGSGFFHRNRPQHPLHQLAQAYPPKGISAEELSAYLKLYQDQQQAQAPKNTGQNGQPTEPTKPPEAK